MSFDFPAVDRWLLSDDSDWLPSKHREVLIEGMRQRDLWYRDLLTNSNETNFARSFLQKIRRAFRLTKQLRQDLCHEVGRAMAKIRIPGGPKPVVARFIDRDVIGAYYDYQDENKLWRSGKKVVAD